eukprot:jgi/Ulvmu1/11396/UM075_0058.1
MRIDLTLKQFPGSSALQESCLAPFGFTLEPFAIHDRVPLNQQPKTAMADLPRCSECGAYINCFCGFDSVGWRCSVCGAYSEYVKKEARRYSKPAAREQLPELNSQVFEALCPEYDLKSVRDGFRVTSGPYPAPRNGHPIVLFFVDICGSEEFLDQVRLALSAALQVLSPHTLVGLITVGERVGLWDVRGGTPVVRNVSIFDDGTVMCPLEDAVPLRALLAQRDASAAQLDTAIDMVQPCGPGERLSLGSALHAVLDYLSVLGDDPPAVTQPGVSAEAAAAAELFGPARLVLLLNNAPTAGKGAVSVPASAAPAAAAAAMPGSHPPSQTPAAALPSAAAVVDMPEDTRRFYDELAGLAAVLGVTVDTFAVGPHPLALAAVAPLCQRTGGSCFHYATQEQAAIPQDLCRRLQTPQALCGLLRVRTCPELRVARVYGRAREDAEHPQLFHIVACDPHDCAAFDLEIATRQGFMPQSSGRATHPVIQVAFQYSLLIYRVQKGDEDAADESAAAAAVASGGRRRVYELQRRLRVLTVAPQVARSSEALYAGLRTEPSMTLLMHKAVRHAARESVADARLLLQDWLAQFIVGWHQHTGKLPEGSTASHTDIDATLSAAPAAIAALVPALHALLRSDPFSPERSVARADGTRALLLLWASLSPPDLLLCLYPMLVAVENVEDVEPSRCPLSLASLRDMPAEMFLLDAYRRVFVMYRQQSRLPFPPQPECMLRKMTKAMREQRRIVPEVVFCREGDAQAAEMQAYLINEPIPKARLDEDEAVEASMLRYEDWLHHLQKRAAFWLATPR